MTILRILAIFALVLAANRLRLQLGVGLAVGSVILAAWCGAPWTDVGGWFAASWVTPELWVMLAVTLLILEVGRHMTEPENAEVLLGLTRRWGGRHGRAAAVMAMPAMVGLVPMPAGALFSAPFVEKAGHEMNSAADWKTVVNYWFRHLWEYWWPLYPGVILTMAIFRVEAAAFLALQLPFTIVAALAGYWVLVRPHRRELPEPELPAPGVDRHAAALTPLGIVIAGTVLLPGPLTPWIPDASLANLVALLIGLVVALACIYAIERKQGQIRLFRTVLSKKNLDVTLTLCGIILFKQMLERSDLMPRASAEMAAAGFPLEIVVAGLPFLAGLVTGICIGFTGTAFPITAALAAGTGGALPTGAALVLGYGFGYMGMMLSPVHLCLIVSRDYFSAPLAGAYRRMLPLVAIQLLYTLAAFLLLRAAGI